MLKQYLDKLNDEDVLFPFSLSTAHRIIAKVDMNPHTLRSVRLTHCVQMYKFNNFELTLYAGWTDSRPSDRYIRTNMDDIIRRYQ